MTTHPLSPIPKAEILKDTVYSPMAFARLLGISKHELLGKESEGILPPAKRDSSRERYYKPEDVTLYRTALGLASPLKSIRKQLFLNFKGGTGKTSLSTSYAYRLAERGYRVLVLDLDSRVVRWNRAMEALDGREPEVDASVIARQIAFNCVPHIDSFLPDGYTKEELKMVNETRKIMEDPAIAVTATTVRVPVFYAHSESVNVETRRPCPPDEVRRLLESAPGVKVVDDPAQNVYPLATEAAGQDLTFVGRIRRDESVDHGVNLWVVADNIRKGAATNSVQIAQLLADAYL